MSRIPFRLLVCDLRSRAGAHTKPAARSPPLVTSALQVWQTSLIDPRALFPAEFISNIRLFLNTVHKATI